MIFALHFKKQLRKVLKKKLSIALEIFKSEVKQSCKAFVLSGGVAANKYICEKLDLFCKIHGLDFFSAAKKIMW